MNPLDTWTHSAESEASPWQRSEWGEFRQLPLAIATQTPNKSTYTTSQATNGLTTSKRSMTHPQANGTSSRQVSPVPAQAQQDNAPDCITPNQPYSGKSLDSSGNVSPNIASSSNPWELPIEDLEQSLGDSEWQAIRQSVRLSARQSLAQATSDNGCLLLPTPTACKGSYRPAGTNRCESQIKRARILFRLATNWSDRLGAASWGFLPIGSPTR